MENFIISIKTQCGACLLFHSVSTCSFGCSITCNVCRYRHLTIFTEESQYIITTIDLSTCRIIFHQPTVLSSNQYSLVRCQSLFYSGCCVFTKNIFRFRRTCYKKKRKGQEKEINIFFHILFSILKGS